MMALFRLFVLVFSLSVVGCSVQKAMQLPDQKDLSLFTTGTPRSALIAEFGPPTQSEVSDDGSREDLFRFTQGYHPVVKTGRVVTHSMLDFISLGMWEVVATPTESYFDGEEMAFHVQYDQQNQVAHVKAMKRTK